MNILILSDVITYSGVGQYMLQLGNELTNYDGVGIVVLASSHIERTDFSQNLVIEKLVEINNIYKYIKNLNLIIRKYNISIVHCNHRKQAFIMRLYQLFFGKIPVVWTCHTVPYPTNWIKRILGYYGHKSIAISSEAKEWLTTALKISNSNIDIILNGVDNTSLIIPQTPKNILKEKFFKDKFSCHINGERTKVIVAHGRLDPVKGHEFLIQAFSKLSIYERKNIRIVFSGNTDTQYYNELQNKIKHYELEDYFFFSGWSKSVEIFSIADLMVAPSLREGFLLAAIEAFFMKVPVIRTKVGGFFDMRNYCVGIPTEDSDTITDLIKEWIANPSIFDGMIERAYKFANEECSVEIMVNRTFRTYKNAIGCCL